MVIVCLVMYNDHVKCGETNGNGIVVRPYPLIKMESWYPTEIYNNDVDSYLEFIEQVFRVQHADGQWRKIVLTAHQRQFHSNDIAIQMERAKSDVVIKSRNTSFTISSIIRLLTGNYHFRVEEVPFTRINDTKVKELLREIKKIIKHMQPVILENGELWPFDPKVVQYTSHEIFFPDREIRFIGYPASASASENIRGLRITRGLNDETNFEAKFQDIQTAMADAKRGSFTNDLNEKVSYLQLTLGTTLKGVTPFSDWYDNLLKHVRTGKIKSWRCLSWPVFDPEIYNSDKPVEEQEGLMPIVEWHNIIDLAEKWYENKNSFLEEYMAIRVPSDETLYNIKKVLASVVTELKNIPTPVNKEGIYYMGIDIAGGGGDYFSISIFEDVNDKMIQRYLYYINKNVDLDELQDFCKKLIDLWLPHKCRIDGNGIGFQLSNNVKKYYPRVEAIRGRQTIKIGKGQSTSIKEFQHTNHIAMFSRGEVELINDEEQIQHYSLWKRNYEADHSKEHGHGDIVISNCLALLPDNWKVGGRHFTLYAEKNEEEKDNNEIKREVIDFHTQSLKDRMSFYNKNNNNIRRG